MSAVVRSNLKVEELFLRWISGSDVQGALAEDLDLLERNSWTMSESNLVGFGWQPPCSEKLTMFSGMPKTARPFSPESPPLSRPSRTNRRKSLDVSDAPASGIMRTEVVQPKRAPRRRVFSFIGGPDVPRFYFPHGKADKIPASLSPVEAAFAALENQATLAQFAAVCKVIIVMRKDYVYRSRDLPFQHCILIIPGLWVAAVLERCLVHGCWRNRNYPRDQVCLLVVLGHVFQNFPRSCLEVYPASESRRNNPQARSFPRVPQVYYRPSPKSGFSSRCTGISCALRGNCARADILLRQSVVVQACHARFVDVCETILSVTTHRPCRHRRRVPTYLTFVRSWSGCITAGELGRSSLLAVVQALDDSVDINTVLKCLPRIVHCLFVCLL